MIGYWLHFISHFFIFLTLILRRLIHFLVMRFIGFTIHSFSFSLILIHSSFSYTTSCCSCSSYTMLIIHSYIIFHAHHTHSHAHFISDIHFNYSFSILLFSRFLPASAFAISITLVYLGMNEYTEYIYVSCLIFYTTYFII
jgi:hypothetical protein